MHRNVIYLDVTAFPIAVERVIEPRLRGRPVIVAPPGAERAIITAASEEARRAGIRKGMPVFRARKLCRNAIVLPPNPVLYERASQAFIRLLNQYSPILEPAGYGRAYLEMTGTTRLFGAARDIAARIQREAATQLHLLATVGVASNKLVSHVAADVIRQAGVQDVRPGDEASFLAPLPVRQLPGVGPATLEQLLEFNIRQIRELADVPLSHLVIAFGAEGVRLHERALGIDPTPVYPPTAAPALLEEKMLKEDSNDYALLTACVFQLIERGARRLRNTHWSTGKITLHLRYADYREAVQHNRLSPPTSTEPRLFTAAQSLLAKTLIRRTRVRYVSIRFSELGPAFEPLPLFPTADDPTSEASSPIYRTIDHLRQRFGDNAIQWGRVVQASACESDEANQNARQLLTRGEEAIHSSNQPSEQTETFWSHAA